jgi:nicotinamide mononucleotide transporter
VEFYTVVEYAGVAFGILGVWLTIRQHVWCWPAGLINVALFTVVFFHARLYGSMLLQGVYLVLSAYGWYAWLRGSSDHGALRVSRTPRRWLAGWLAGALISGVALGAVLAMRTDQALPYWDAGATTCSLAAQWMTTRKWIENWLVWIVVDVVYVGMYVSQQLYPTAALYGVFLVMAALGYREWRASMRADQTSGAGA